MIERRKMLESLVFVPFAFSASCLGKQKNTKNEKPKIEDIRVAIKKDAFDEVNILGKDSKGNKYFPGSVLGLDNKKVIKVGANRKYTASDSLVLKYDSGVDFTYGDEKLQVYSIKEEITTIRLK